MRVFRQICALALLASLCSVVHADPYSVTFDFEDSWDGDYAPGWENAAYRHGEAPVGKMMEQVDGGHTGSGMKLTADSVPEDWMWWASVEPTTASVNPGAMAKEYNPYVSVWYYDEGHSADKDDPAGQLYAVPSWVNNYNAAGEDWTDIQVGARFTAEDKYYYVAAGEDSPGWQDTGVSRPTDSAAWHQLKIQLSSDDGKVHFYVDGSEVGSTYRADYVDLGQTIGL